MPALAMSLHSVVPIENYGHHHRYSTKVDQPTRRSANGGLTDAGLIATRRKMADADAACPPPGDLLAPAQPAAAPNRKAKAGGPPLSRKMLALQQSLSGQLQTFAEETDGERSKASQPPPADGRRSLVGLSLLDLLRMGGDAHRAGSTRDESEAWRACAALLTPPRDRRSQHRAALRNPSNGWLPLHFAVAEHAPRRLVELLLRCWSGAAAEGDDDGWTPLHVAVSFGAPMELIELLLKVNKDAARARDIGNNLPLHLAVSKDASVDLVAALLGAYPGAARQWNNFGRSALHLAVMREVDESGLPTGRMPSASVVRALLDVYPRAAAEADATGCLPTHYAEGGVGGALAEAHSRLTGLAPPPHPREGLEAEKREREAKIREGQAKAKAQAELEAKEAEEQKKKEEERMANEAEEREVAAAAAAAAQKAADAKSAAERQAASGAKKEAREWLASQQFTPDQVKVVETRWNAVNKYPDKAQTLRDAFERADFANDGSISRAELVETLRSDADVIALLKSPDPPVEFDSAFAGMGADETSGVVVEEFVQHLLEVIGVNSLNGIEFNLAGMESLDIEALVSTHAILLGSIERRNVVGIC